MDTLSTKTYIFVLGREVDLCFAELKAVLSQFNFDYDITNVAKNTVFINIDNTSISSVAGLSDVLGGTIKIFEIIKKRGSNLASDIYDSIVANTQELDRVEFGISLYDSRVTPKISNTLGLNIKKRLKNIKSARFIALTDSQELSSIVSLKQGLLKKGIEIGVFSNCIGRLVGLSNAQEWSERDYDKPRGDKRSGMLPPKLARIMANLALSKVSLEFRIKNSELNTINTKLSTLNTLVLDPFCGSGNVLMEAMLLGHDVFGSDLSSKAVEDSKENIKWLRKAKSEKLKAKSIMTIADATKINIMEQLSSFGLKLSTYDGIAVVSEPYLGEPKKFKPSLNAARGEYAKIKDIYIHFLINLKKLLTSNSRLSNSICLVFPLVDTIEGKQYSLYRECVDEIEKIGYTELQSPLIYGRDYQVVKREIALLALE